MGRVSSTNIMIVAAIAAMFFISACQSMPDMNPQQGMTIKHSENQQSRLNDARNKLNNALGEYGTILGEIHGNPTFTAIYGWTKTVIQSGDGQPEVIEWRNPDNDEKVCEDGEAQVSCKGPCPCE